jgi:hypothetical protein
VRGGGRKRTDCWKSKANLQIRNPLGRLLAWGCSGAAASSDPCSGELHWRLSPLPIGSQRHGLVVPAGRPWMASHSAGARDLARLLPWPLLQNPIFSPASRQLCRQQAFAGFAELNQRSGREANLLAGETGCSGSKGPAASSAAPLAAAAVSSLAASPRAGRARQASPQFRHSRRCADRNSAAPTGSRPDPLGSQPVMIPQKP